MAEDTKKTKTYKKKKKQFRRKNSWNTQINQQKNPEDNFFIFFFFTKQKLNSNKTSKENKHKSDIYLSVYIHVWIT